MRPSQDPNRATCRPDAIAYLNGAALPNSQAADGFFRSALKFEQLKNEVEGLVEKEKGIGPKLTAEEVAGACQWVECMTQDTLNLISARESTPQAPSIGSAHNVLSYTENFSPPTADEMEPSGHNYWVLDYREMLLEYGMALTDLPVEERREPERRKAVLCEVFNRITRSDLPVLTLFFDGANEEIRNESGISFPDVGRRYDLRRADSGMLAGEKIRFSNELQGISDEKEQHRIIRRILIDHSMVMLEDFIERGPAFNFPESNFLSLGPRELYGAAKQLGKLDDPDAQLKIAVAAIEYLSPDKPCSAAERVAHVCSEVAGQVTRNESTLSKLIEQRAVPLFIEQSREQLEARRYIAKQLSDHHGWLVELFEAS